MEATVAPRDNTDNSAQDPYNHLDKGPKDGIHEMLRKGRMQQQANVLQ
jgi:hypothetical protein